jgi:hypothetical protein
MEYATGIILAVSVGLFASVVGFDKERTFYPVVLIVVGTYYLLFAAEAGSKDALASEALPAIMFAAAAAFGFRRSLWLVVAGLASHGVFDFFHHGVITNPGVPVWWPGFCLSYDVTAAIYLAALLVIRRVQIHE